jgi:hypothetical protein
MAGQRVVLDRRMLPDEFQELRFVEDPATVFEQNQQNLEGFGGERRMGAAPPQEALAWIDHVGPKPIAAWLA